jgi:hypothetical protein
MSPLEQALLAAEALIEEDTITEGIKPVGFPWLMTSP